MWVWPVVSGLAAFVAGTVLVEVDLAPDGFAGRLTRDVDIDAASSLLQVVAGSAITVTTLTFSLTVVALQLASQQFSPRLLREFTRDPFTRAVLAVLVGTFVLALTVLRNLRLGDEAPALAVLAAFFMGLVSLGTVLGFITHIARALRVDAVMSGVHGETSSAVRLVHPAPEDAGPPPPPAPGTDGLLVTSRDGGFVRYVDHARLVALARRHDLVCHLTVVPGDLVVAGNPLARLWARGSATAPVLDEETAEELARAVRGAVPLGFERTMEHDAAFGFRQLGDIAGRALSPGINDPVTAVHALGHLSDLTVVLLGRHLGARARTDDDEVVRLVLPGRDLRYYLDLVCGPLRRYAAAEPTVLVALLRLLRDAATAASTRAHRSEVLRQADLVVAGTSEDLLPADRAGVLDLRARVGLALDGDVVAAYDDRAGETRSA